MFGSHPLQIVGFTMLLLLVTAGAGTALRRMKGKDASEYFLGGSGIGSVTMGASLFVTAVAGMWLLNTSFAVNGIGLWSGIGAAFFVLVLGLVFAPMYLRSRVFTVPQFLAHRFDDTTGLLWSGLSIFFYVGIKIPLVLTLATWTIEGALGWDMIPSVGLMVVVVLIGLYTVAGGCPAVVYTQYLQAIVVLAGSIAILFLLILFPGGAGQLVGGHIADARSISWTMIAIALPILLSWQWLADQYVLQRIFGARNIRTVRTASLITAGFIVAEVLILAGIAILANDAVAGRGTGFVPDELLRGIASVAFMALIMATLSSDMHSAATLFTMDFYRAFYPEARDESLVLVGRLSTTMIVVLAILAISAVSLVDDHLIATFEHMGMLVAPPIAAVFLVGFSWNRANGKGALWALLIGEFLAAAHFAVVYFREESVLSPGSFSGVTFLVSALVLVVVSLGTAAPPAEASSYFSMLRRKQG